MMSGDEALCACAATLANCIAVRAVVASSTSRSWVMMVSIPGMSSEFSAF